MDLSSLSNDELMAIAGASSAPDLSSMPTEQLIALAGVAPKQEPSFGQTLRNEFLSIGNRAIEGAADLGQMAVRGAFAGFPLDALGVSSTPTDTAKDVLEAAQVYGPEKAQTQAGRVLGQVAYNLPSAALPGGSLPMRVASAVGAGTGSGIAREITDNPYVDAAATIAGGVTPSVFSLAGSLFSRTFDSVKNSLVGASDDQARAIAANTVKEYTGLTPEQIQAGIAARPVDDLGRAMTTAELTQNAPMAQIEKTVSREGQLAERYNAALDARRNIRESLIADMADAKSVNPEGLGATMTEQARKVSGSMDTAASELWKQIPRDVPVPIDNHIDELIAVVGRRQAGLPLDRRVSTLVDQFANVDNGLLRTSGELQDIRSDALALLRTEKLTGHEENVLNVLQKSIDNAMNEGLTGPAYDTWEGARRATAQKAELFDRGTVGGTLTRDDLRTSNALANSFRGDSKSVDQLEAAMGYNAQIMDEVTRGVLDRIPRDTQGQLTPNKVGNFLKANEGGLKRLLGDEHFAALNRISDDLKSEASVQGMAYRSSKNNSITAQSNSVAAALSSTVMDSATPKGLLGQAVSMIRDYAKGKTKAKVDSLLFEAAMNPEFALELVQKATPEAVTKAASRIAMGLSSGALRSAGMVAANSQETASDAQQQPEPTPGSRSEGSALDRLASELIGRSANTPAKPEQTKESKSEAEINPVSYDNANLFADLFSTADMKGGSVDADTYKQFSAKVVDIADELGADPRDLMAVMRFETGGTLNPAEKNRAGSGATGLIQFMPKTAQSLTGAETKEAAIKLMESMSPVEQLDYVQKYLAPFKGKLNSLDDVYMAVLWPKAVGKDPDYALFERGTKAYWQNRGLDLDKDGVITKAEAASKVRNFSDRKGMVEA